MERRPSLGLGGWSFSHCLVVDWSMTCVELEQSPKNLYLAVLWSRFHHHFYWLDKQLHVFCFNSIPEKKTTCWSSTKFANHFVTKNTVWFLSLVIKHWQRTSYWSTLHQTWLDSPRADLWRFVDGKIVVALENTPCSLMAPEGSKRLHNYGKIHHVLAG